MDRKQIASLKVNIRRTASLAYGVKDDELRAALEYLGALQIQILDSAIDYGRHKTLTREDEFAALTASMSGEKNEYVAFLAHVHPNTITRIRRKYDERRPVGRPRRKATG